jgi:ectoine hydroxylase-related dioxygenase (phytanoyl-CoA dioxygenase family)
LPHQDISYIKGEKDTLVAWISLGDYPEGSGGLEVGHASHALGLLPSHPNDEGRFNCSVAHMEKYDIDWRSAHYQMGDLLIMHALTLHASGKNLSNHFRLSLDCRFSDLCGSINEDQLLPPYYPKLPMWNQFCNTLLANDLISIPSSLCITKSQQPMEDILKQKSIFL